MENKTTIWIPVQEVEEMENWKNKMIEKGNSMDWAFRAIMQVRFEKGHFDDMEPIIREGLRLQVYSK